MLTKFRLHILVVVVVLIVGAIIYLESLKVDIVSSRESTNLQNKVAPSLEVAEKKESFRFAEEISTPDGFINTEAVTVESLIGNKIILIDFWTYSCINCQRTTPFLNAWHNKYKDEGLVILGVHTPEFEFEKKYENVLAAVDEFEINYPVILDNDFSTWRAYNNRYWPRKYLIDIDGYIVYDHIGEGGYEETERVIQELLQERKERLNDDVKISADTLVSPENTETTTARSPEVYFGAWRNDLLANGVQRKEGVQSFSVTDEVALNTLQFQGDWNIFYEYSTNVGGGTIVFPYTASKVHMVASGDDSPVAGKVFIDGVLVDTLAGSDVTSTGEVIFNEERLYNLIDDPNGPATHILEIKLDSPGLKAYTFTFG